METSLPVEVHEIMVEVVVTMPATVVHHELPRVREQANSAITQTLKDIKPRGVHMQVHESVRKLFGHSNKCFFVLWLLGNYQAKTATRQHLGHELHYLGHVDM